MAVRGGQHANEELFSELTIVTYCQGIRQGLCILNVIHLFPHLLLPKLTPCCLFVGACLLTDLAQSLCEVLLDENYYGELGDPSPGTRHLPAAVPGNNGMYQD